MPTHYVPLLGSGLSVKLNGPSNVDIPLAADQRVHDGMALAIGPLVCGNPDFLARNLLADSTQVNLANPIS